MDSIELLVHRRAASQKKRAPSKAHIPKEAKELGNMKKNR
jgi:hypothetical protein